MVDEAAVTEILEKADDVRGFIFDVDHTVTKRSTGGSFARHAIREGMVSRAFLAALPFWYLRYRTGAMDVDDLSRGMPALKGLARDDLLRVSREAFEDRISGGIFRWTEVLIRRLLDAGRPVFLATSSLEIVVRPLADHLGVRDVISTRLEFRDGKCTGHFLSGPAFGREKLDMVVGYLRAYGLEPADCAFFSDSAFDLPLLEASGFPVAVNPDSRLAATARRTGWPIIRFREIVSDSSS
jgi:HAD superfamily hydrolase (TIGR01490 family)